MRGARSPRGRKHPGRRLPAARRRPPSGRHRDREEHRPLRDRGPLPTGSRASGSASRPARTRRAAARRRSTWSCGCAGREVHVDAPARLRHALGALPRDRRRLALLSGAGAGPDDAPDRRHRRGRPRRLPRRRGRPRARAPRAAHRSRVAGRHAAHRPLRGAGRGRGARRRLARAARAEPGGAASRPTSGRPTACPRSPPGTPGTHGPRRRLRGAPWGQAAGRSRTLAACRGAVSLAPAPPHRPGGMPPARRAGARGVRRGRGEVPERGVPRRVPPAGQRRPSTAARTGCSASSDRTGRGPTGTAGPTRWVPRRSRPWPS